MDNENEKAGAPVIAFPTPKDISKALRKADKAKAKTAKKAAAKPKAKKTAKPKAKATKKPAKKAAKVVKTKRKAGKVKVRPAVVARTERLDLRLTKAEKAKLNARAKVSRRTITSLVIELIEKMK